MDHLRNERLLFCLGFVIRGIMDTEVKEWLLAKEYCTSDEYRALASSLANIGSKIIDKAQVGND